MMRRRNRRRGGFSPQQGEPDAAVTHFRAAIKSKPGFG
jgi:hypothetical protein